MKNRLTLILSVTAVLVAVFGATPLGQAAGRLASTIPPFAKKAGYANLAGNAAHLGGHTASAAGGPGTIPVLGAQGKLPASVGAVGAQGPEGKQGPQGERGPAGPTDTSKLLGRTVTVKASRAVPANSGRTDYVVCPGGYEAVGGGVFVDGDAAGSYPGFVIDSLPATNGQATGDGTGGPANSWRATVYNVKGFSVAFQWEVVCAKVGA